MFTLHRIPACCTLMNMHDSFYIWSLLTLLVAYTVLHNSPTHLTHTQLCTLVLFTCNYSRAESFALIQRNVMCPITPCAQQAAFLTAQHFPFTCCARTSVRAFRHQHAVVRVCSLCTGAWKHVPGLVMLHSQEHPRCELSAQVRGPLWQVHLSVSSKLKNTVWALCTRGPGLHPACCMQLKSRLIK